MRYWFFGSRVLGPHRSEHLHAQLADVQLPDRCLRRLRFARRAGAGESGIVSAKVLDVRPVRCQAARIPDEREFATKADLAKAMVIRGLAPPLPISWVTADSAYGQKWRFRRTLEELGVGYVLAVPKSRHGHALGRIYTIRETFDGSCGIF